jgi:ubiquinone/menaquinone biosynthesis C-methylase UbiE
MDPRRRFSSLADDYARYRPSYPAELLDWLEREAGLKRADRVADLGCGTGIFTRLLAARGFAVTGVDPNAEMLERARPAGGGHYVQAPAEATGLPDSSYRLASAAQAFHWFDRLKVLAELRRILAPGAPCAAIWNLRAESPLLDEYEKLLVRFSPDYRELQTPQETIEKLADAAKSSKQAAFAFEQVFDRDSFMGRVWSSSYVSLGVKDRPAFDAELNALFARHAEGESIRFPYKTTVLLFIP